MPEVIRRLRYHPRPASAELRKTLGFKHAKTPCASTLHSVFKTWPGLAQVYEYRTERKHHRTHKITKSVQYSITSLTPSQASAERVYQLRRGHWTRENLLHRTRDMLFGEDASQLRWGESPQVMAALRNTVLTLLRSSGWTHIAKALRFLAARPTETLKIIQNTQNEN